METVRTTNVQNDLTAELNRLARTDIKALRRRITELLQSTTPAVITQFGLTMRDNRLNLEIVSVVVDCKNELMKSVLLNHTQGPTRRGIANLMAAGEKLRPADQDLTDDIAIAKSRAEKPLIQPNGLVKELLELLAQKGEDGVRQKVKAIFAKSGVGTDNLNASNALGHAVDYFRQEEKRDPSGNDAQILKIIEENFTII